LADHDRVFYYIGLPSDAKNSIKESNYKADGIRKVLLDHNIDANIAAIKLKQQKDLMKITQQQYQTQLDVIKGGKDTPTVVIKALDTSSYKNLIDALDEMQICNIGKYVIDVMDGDSKALIKAQEAKTPAK
jgi:biopolymer transport protein ExbD